MLKTNTIFIGKVLIKLGEVDSTTNYLQKLLLSQQIVEGTAVLASFQLSGKGQRNNKWESDADKNLLCSILLNPKFLPARHSFFLTIITALAVKDTIQEFLDEKVFIKWPNDIWVKERKIAGILINNTLAGRIINSSIIGIGLNINQTNFPATLEASSIKTYVNTIIKIEEVFSLLCLHLERRYLELKSGKVEKLKMEYRADLLGLNEHREYLDSNEHITFTGLIKGVNAAGQLAIQLQNGTIRHYNNKEIIFLKKKGQP